MLDLSYKCEFSGNQMISPAQDDGAHILDILASSLYSWRKWKCGSHLYLWLILRMLRLSNLCVQIDQVTDGHLPPPRRQNFTSLFVC